MPFFSVCRNETLTGSANHVRSRFYPAFLDRLTRRDIAPAEAARALNAAKKEKARAARREFHDAMARQLGRSIRWPS